MADLRKSVLTTYHGYTTSFQSAYDRFIADPGAGPDPTPALPFYHAPCLFITPVGVSLYAESSDLARHFEQVMLDMQSKRYLRTGLGEPQITFLGPQCALLSLEIARFDVDENQYDEYGVTYTLHSEGKDEWRIAVVTTHPKNAVIHESNASGASR